MLPGDEPLGDFDDPFGEPGLTPGDCWYPPGDLEPGGENGPDPGDLELGGEDDGWGLEFQPPPGE